MEDISRGNKRKTMIMVCVGVTILILFIGIRLAVKQAQESSIDAPTIDDPEYADAKLPTAKNNIQKLEDIQDAKEEEEIYGKDKDKFISNNFNEAFKIESEENKIVEPKKEENKPINVTTSTNPSYENYSYKKPKKQYLEQEIKVVEEKPKIIVEEVKATFGTIKKNSNTSTVKGESFNAVKCLIYGDQKISDGNGVTIRNVNPIVYNSLTIPINSILKGKAEYKGNRVRLHIYKAETKSGSFTIDFLVMDNDNIEGIQYKSAIDEVKHDKTDQLNTNRGGTVLNSIINRTLDGAKELAQKSRSLELSDGYTIYLIPNNINK